MTSSSSTTTSKGADNSSPTTTTTTYSRFSLAELPDELFLEDVPLEEWIGGSGDDSGSKSKSQQRPWFTTTTSQNGFQPNELQNLDGTPTTIPSQVEYERLVGIALYMIGNVAPFSVPLLSVLAFGFHIEYAKTCLYAMLVYIGVLFVIEYFYYYPKFNQHYKNIQKKTKTAAATASETDQTTTSKPDQSRDSKDEKIRRAQYLWTERNTTKYLSMSYVWPANLNIKDRSAIFCVIPHGLAPYGIVGYPVWSKLWNSLTCRWTCAPVILTLPLIGKFMSQIGYIPAKSKNIVKVLETGQNNVGIILDGMDGMFHNTNPNSQNDEIGCILSRKGIVKIALRAGTPLIPVYGFGHTAMYTVWVDPFGILQYLSTLTGTSLTPFFGRWGWPLGPPHRQIVTMCLGTPIECPKIDDPTQEDINKYHQLLLKGFEQTFNDHKVGFYGTAKGTDKQLKFVK